MCNKRFVPELHDIGKLVDDCLKDSIGLKTSRGRKHTFEKFVFNNYKELVKPSSPSWFGQYHHIMFDFTDEEWVDDCPKGHHCEKIAQIENDKWDIIPLQFRCNLFLLIIADHLASSVSRATLEVGRQSPPHKGLLKLWNKKSYERKEKEGKSWVAFNTVDDLKVLFNEIQSCKSGEEFLEKYKEYLLLTPEDGSIPRNVTSLYTHLELVGKIYRVLKKNSRLVKKGGDSLSVEYDGIKVKTIKEAEGDRFTYYKDKKGVERYGKNKGKWQARLIKCWIKFPHSFVRLQDINLLRKREELVNTIAKNYKDEVIFTTSDFITLFLSPNQDLKEIFEPLLEYGFYIEADETIADLGILTSALDRKTLKARKMNERPRLTVLNSRGTKIFKKLLLPEFQTKIQPHICDVCQQRRGVERIKEAIREWICEKCEEIRKMGVPFREYTTWEEERVKVCWFKFSLNQNRLEEWLENKFKRYVDKYNFKHAEVLKEEFRPLALQVDFNKDYKKMLKEFWEEFGRFGDVKKPIVDYNELGVFKYYPELTRMIIEKFLNLFEQYFPDCASDENSPIRLSLSIASIKYPIREHWRFFEESNKNFINVRFHRVFDEKYTKNELEIIIEKVVNVETSSSFLHKLVQLEKSLQSNIQVAVEIFNNKRKYPEIYELFSRGIKPSKFLNLYRLLKGEE